MRSELPVTVPSHSALHSLPATPLSRSCTVRLCRESVQSPPPAQPLRGSEQPLTLHSCSPGLEPLQSKPVPFASGAAWGGWVSWGQGALIITTSNMQTWGQAKNRDPFPRNLDRSQNTESQRCLGEEGEEIHRVGGWAFLGLLSLPA